MQHVKNLNTEIGNGCSQLAGGSEALISLKLLISVVFFESFNWLEKQHGLGEISCENLCEVLVFFPWIFISIYLEMTKICAEEGSLAWAEWYY